MTPWLRIYRPRPRARIRLFCLAQVGGAASFFRDWGPLLADHVELCAVQYPGRENRLTEPCLTAMAPMVDALAEALDPHLDRPAAIFGHSMGASIGFELARRLDRSHPGTVCRLFVSGREAPTMHEHPLDGPPDRPAHTLGDDDLVRLVTSLGGTSPEVFADPELRALLLPGIRSDYQLIETYRPSPGAPLSHPITVLTGDRDPYVTVAEAAAWADVTTASCDLQVFRGDHFYLLPQLTSVVAAIVARLTDTRLEVFA